MTEKIKWSLGSAWLVVSLFALALPVFLPSYPHGPGLLSNVIATSTVTMFVLSFPSSLFGFPFLFVMNEILGVHPNSIQGMYTNLTMFFVLGLAQWFWLVPRLFQREPMIQTLECSIRELQPSREPNFDLFRARDRTPLERVLEDGQTED